MRTSAIYLVEVMDAGFNAYVVKDLKAEEVFNAIESSKEIKSYISSSISSV